jgi:hypothetical protein
VGHGSDNGSELDAHPGIPSNTRVWNSQPCQKVLLPRQQVQIWATPEKMRQIQNNAIQKDKREA